MTDQNTAQILHMGVDSLVDDAKASEDYSKEVIALLEGKVTQLEKAGRLDEAVEEILPLEKKCRQVSDAISCSKLCQKIVLMYKPKAGAGASSVSAWEKVREMMVVLSRKRGQLRRVVSDLVNTGMLWLNDAGLMKKGDKLHQSLLDTLLEITAGKIFVEVERSRLVSIQADIKEHIEKDLDGAAMLLQEVQVETFSSMDKIEKSRFILNQMRLMLLRKDYVRVQIASRKISEKFLGDEDMQEIKIEYLQYMVQYYLFGEAAFAGRSEAEERKKKENKKPGSKDKDADKKKAIGNNSEGTGNFLEVTKCYQKMFCTQIVKKREESQKESEVDRKVSAIPIPSWREVLSHWLIYLALSKANDDSSEFMTNTMEKWLPRKQLEAFENLSGLVRSLMTKKLIQWPLKFEGELKGHKVFADPINGPTRFQILRKRIIQHNLKVCSLYYSRISTDRLMQLLALSQKELESELAALVVDGSLYARIDRPARLIHFGQGTTSEQAMNEWSSSIEGVLDLVREAGHLISKEKMVQEARMKAMKAK